MSPNPGPPPVPPVLPPAVNEEVLAPKHQMAQVRKAAEKRMKKWVKKFEKNIRKFIKKKLPKDTYCEFYDVGYRFEAVFTEISGDGYHFLGHALNQEMQEELQDFLSKALNPEKLKKEDIEITYIESPENPGLQMVHLIAVSEWAEIQRLQQKVEKAPRRNNPGI